MGPITKTSFLSLLLLLTLSSDTSAAASTTCTNSLLALSACLPYAAAPPIAASSSASSECCSSFVSILPDGNGSCLCDLFREPPVFGIQLNYTRILSLYSVCPLPDHLNVTYSDSFSLLSFCYAPEAPAPVPSPAPEYQNHSDSTGLSPGSAPSPSVVHKSGSVPHKSGPARPPPSLRPRMDTRPRSAGPSAPPPSPPDLDFDTSLESKSGNIVPSYLLILLALGLMA